MAHGFPLLEQHGLLSETARLPTVRRGLDSAEKCPNLLGASALVRGKQVVYMPNTVSSL